MDLLPTPEQEEIVTTVRSLLERDFNLNTLAERDGADSVVDRSLWAKCAELGWFGLGMDESLGGVGYTLAEEALLFTEIGAHATPGPFLATVLGARLAALSGAHDIAGAILSGESIVALAEPHTPGAASASPTVSGTFRVTDHGSADLILVMVGTSSALINASDMVAEPMASIDLLVPIAVGTVSDVSPDRRLRGEPRTGPQGQYPRRRGTRRHRNRHCRAVDPIRKGPRAVRHAHRSVPGGQAPLCRYGRSSRGGQLAGPLRLISALEGLTDANFHAHAARSLAATYAITNSQINVQNHGGPGSLGSTRRIATSHGRESVPRPSGRFSHTCSHCSISRLLPESRPRG
ncbi:MAG: acyl-CoA dehydrogenase family protein [Microthrixaceae bacterium]